MHAEHATQRTLFSQGGHETMRVNGYATSPHVSNTSSRFIATFTLMCIVYTLQLKTDSHLSSWLHCRGYPTAFLFVTFISSYLVHSSSGGRALFTKAMAMIANDLQEVLGLSAPVQHPRNLSACESGSVWRRFFHDTFKNALVFLSFRNGKSARETG